MGMELCNLYDGERILKKHARYSDFIINASDEEKHYFAFTGQRNPLDALVTLYFRAKYEKIEKMQANPNLEKWKNRTKRIAKWRYINDNDMSFEQYFNLYHSVKIDRSYRKVDRARMDYVYRYENLQEDFSAILEAIGIEQKRELPQHSTKTKRKSSDFYQYFTPSMRSRVQIVYGRSYKEMGYSFPDDWVRPALKDWLLFYKDMFAKLSVRMIGRTFSILTSFAKS